MGLQLFINDREIELSDRSKIGLTYAINDLNNLQNRQGFFSNEFVVDKTRENQITLEFASSLNSATNVPYAKNIAKIVQDGIEIVPDGTALVQSFDGQYKITVYSGNIDLFDAIGDANITDMDFSDLIHNWDYATVLASQANDDSDGYIYPLVEWGKTAATIPPGLSVASAKLFLFVFCKTVFDRIISGRGYAIDGTYYVSSLLANLLLSVDKWVKSADYMATRTVSNVLSADDAGNFFDIAPTGGGSTNTGQVFNFDLNTPSSPEMNATVAIFTPAATIWGTLRITGSVLFIKNSLYFDSVEYIIDIYDVSGGGGLVVSQPGWTTIDMYPSGTVEHSFDLGVFGQFGGGRNYQARITMKSNLPTANGDGMNFTWRAGNSYSFIPLETLNIGDEVDPTALLPNIKQKDFIKGLCNMASVAFQTNVITKKISFNFLDDIIGNLYRAKDWSDKIDVDSITITYRNSNYAQRNFFRYKKDETVEEFYGDGYIDCPDLNLDKEKDLVQLPFAASEYVNNLGARPIPVIKSYVGISQFDKVEPRIVRLSKTASSGIRLYNSANGAISSLYTDAPVCFFIDPARTISLGFNKDLIANHYKAISGILQKYKDLSALFKLTAVDISELDFLVPIYIDIHTAKHDINGYFYLNKVSNYKGGSLTQCNLIRL